MLHNLFQKLVLYMSKVIYVRHGHRPAYATDDIKKEWRESDRYKHNKLDQPLTELGMKESF